MFVGWQHCPVNRKRCPNETREIVVVKKTKPTESLINEMTGVFVALEKTVDGLVRFSNVFCDFWLCDMQIFLVGV